MALTNRQTALAWVLTLLLAALFGFAGIVKLIPTQQAAEGFAHLGYPAWFRVIIGIWEVAGAIGLLIPRYSPETASTLAILMLGAIFTCITAGVSVWPPLVVLLLLGSHITLRSQEPT